MIGAYENCLVSIIIIILYFRREGTKYILSIVKRKKRKEKRLVRLRRLRQGLFGRSWKTDLIKGYLVTFDKLALLT